MTGTAGPTVTPGVAPIFQSRHLSTGMRIVAAMLYFLSRTAVLTHRVRLSMCIDDAPLDIVLHELDTITDLTAYLSKKRGLYDRVE